MPNLESDIAFTLGRSWVASGAALVDSPGVARGLGSSAASAGRYLVPACLPLAQGPGQDVPADLGPALHVGVRLGASRELGRRGTAPASQFPGCTVVRLTILAPPSPARSTASS